MIASLNSGDPAKSTPLGVDGTLRMFWIDACEERGVIYLFGKAWNGQTKSYVSCCVVVKNIERNLFVLPRETILAGKSCVCFFFWLGKLFLVWGK